MVVASAEYSLNLRGKGCLHFIFIELLATWLLEQTSEYSQVTFVKRGTLKLVRVEVGVPHLYSWAPRGTR